MFVDPRVRSERRRRADSDIADGVGRKVVGIGDQFKRSHDSDRCGLYAKHVVVREGASRWQAESGQYLLALESDGAGSIAVIEPVLEPALSAGELCEQAMSLEESDTEEAVRLYAAAVAADGRLTDAYVNLGRLLHELGRVAEAERIYRVAIDAGLDEPLLSFNLGVLLEDCGRKVEALDSYAAVLRMNPRNVDALHNAALLADQLGRAQEAIRYMAQYRRLGRSK